METPAQMLEKCPKCGRHIDEEGYLCGLCGNCQYCCQCSTDTNPESTLPGD